MGPAVRGGTIRDHKILYPCYVGFQRRVLILFLEATALPT